MGNFACADEESVSAVTRMAPYAFHFHAKDFHMKKAGQWADPGEGWFKSRGAIIFVVRSSVTGRKRRRLHQGHEGSRVSGTPFH